MIIPQLWDVFSQALVYLIKETKPRKIPVLIVGVERRFAYTLYEKVYKVFKHFEDIIDPFVYRMVEIADKAIEEHCWGEIYQRLLNYVASSEKVSEQVREASILVSGIVESLFPIKKEMKYVQDFRIVCDLTNHLLKVEQNRKELEKLRMIYLLAVAGKPVTHKVVKQILFLPVDDSLQVIENLIKGYVQGIDFDMLSESIKLIQFIKEAEEQTKEDKKIGELIYGSFTEENITFENNVCS